ncbi:MAG: GNAT family N-acetyltransferase [Bdellovibrionia bacterium]
MIRKVKNKTEWSDIRKICCETGKSGAPIERERWKFFGEHWVGPYETLLADWTWVATQHASNGSEEVIGYLTGCPDSAQLARKRILRFDFPLVLAILHKRYPINMDVRRYLKRRFKLEKSPEELFPENVNSMLRSLYPAHLHINLTEKARGNGTGRKLVETYFEALREKRVCGVHVHCGSAPVRFYERLGFEILHSVEVRPGVSVYCLGIAL